VDEDFPCASYSGKVFVDIELLTREVSVTCLC